MHTHTHNRTNAMRKIFHSLQSHDYFCASNEHFVGWVPTELIDIKSAFVRFTWDGSTTDTLCFVLPFCTVAAMALKFALTMVFTMASGIETLPTTDTNTHEYIHLNQFKNTRVHTHKHNTNNIPSSKNTSLQSMCIHLFVLSGLSTNIPIGFSFHAVMFCGWDQLNRWVLLFSIIVIVIVIIIFLCSLKFLSFIYSVCGRCTSANSWRPVRFSSFSRSLSVNSYVNSNTIVWH